MTVVGKPADFPDLERWLTAKAESGDGPIRGKVGIGRTLSSAVEANGITAQPPYLQGVLSPLVVNRFAPEHVALSITEHQAIFEVNVANGVDLQAERLFISRNPKWLGGRDGYPLVGQSDGP
jgi:hypothetical protein